MECFYLNLGGTAGRVTTFCKVPLQLLFFLHNRRPLTPSLDWDSGVGLNL